MQLAQHEGLAAGDVVVIGVDPARGVGDDRGALDTREILRTTGTFPTTTAGHAAMVKSSSESE